MPIAAWDDTGATVSIRKAGTPDEDRTYRRKLDGGGFAAWGVGDVAWIEASLPKRAGDDNIEGVGTDQAWELLHGLHAEAAGFLEYRDDTVSGVNGERFEFAKVKRLDLVRDFDEVKAPGWIMDGLANVPVQGRAKRRRYADGDRNRAQTLTVGPLAAWAATLYDKHEETMGGPVVAPEGRVRFEARLRSDVLSGQWARDQAGGNIAQVMDLNEARLQRMTRAMFGRVGFDRTVSAPGRLADVVFGADLCGCRDRRRCHRLHSDLERRNLWCHLTAEPHGVDLGFSRMTHRKYRRMAAELGVVIEDPTANGPGVVVQLDYQRGREVTRLAA